MREHAYVLIILIVGYVLKLDRSEIQVLEGMNKPKTSAIQKPSREDVEALGNILSSFIVDVPDKFGWWYRILTPNKGIDSVVKKLFPHFGTLFGMPEHTMSELLCIIGTVKKRAAGYYANVDMWTEFKSHNHFTNRNIEIAMCKFQNSSFYFIKVGHVDKGPVALCNE